jgi:hypothetical protein
LLLAGRRFRAEIDIDRTVRIDQKEGAPTKLRQGRQAHTLRNEAKIRARHERINALESILEELAENSEYDMVRLKAAEAWLNRQEGMPVARNVNMTAQAPRDFDFNNWPDDKLEALNTLLRDEPAAAPAITDDRQLSDDE